MISGEAGTQIVDAAVKLRELIDGDEVTAQMIAACFVDAIRKGETPREVALALWDGLPGDDDWILVMRAQVVEALEAAEDRAPE